MDAAPVGPTTKAGAKFTVVDPAKTTAERPKPKPDRKKIAAQVVVDKNALSARGSAPKVGHSTKGPKGVTLEPPAAAAPTWAVVVRGKKHGKKATAPEEEKAGGGAGARNPFAEGAQEGARREDWGALPPHAEAPWSKS